MKPWLIYCRVSTDQQVEGVSLSLQQQQCQEYAAAQGLVVSEVVLDEGISAKDLERPGIRRIIQEVERESISGIIVWKLDRLSRCLEDILKVMALFRIHSARIVSPHELIPTGDDATASDRLMLSMRGAFAQFEREQIAFRIRSAMRHLKKEGKYIGGVVPVGCKVIGESRGKQLERDDNTAPIVENAFIRYANGASLRDISRFLHKSGVTKTARTPTNIAKHILRNKVLVEKAVVPPDVFATVQKTIANRWSPFKDDSGDNPDRNHAVCRRGERVSFLRGLAFCVCGRPLIGASSYGRSKKYFYLRCSSRASVAPCGHRDLPIAPIEESVIAAVIDASKSEYLSRQWDGYLRELIISLDPRLKEIESLEIDRGADAAGLDRLLGLVEVGHVAARAAAHRISELQARIEVTDQQIARLRRVVAWTKAMSNSNDFARKQFDLAANRLATAPEEEIGDILKCIITRVVVCDNPPRLSLSLLVPKPPGVENDPQANRPGEFSRPVRLPVSNGGERRIRTCTRGVSAWTAEQAGAGAVRRGSP
jgi:DNA invertase Pin-like site-specific DNA recombinase